MIVKASNGGIVFPIKEVESCNSPNSFQIIQDLREEGEIDERGRSVVKEDTKGAVDDREMLRKLMK